LQETQTWATCRKGVLSAAVARNVIEEAEGKKTALTSLKRELDANIAATSKWSRGQQLIVRPLLSYQIGNLTTEPSQTIANRDKNELLGVYRSALKDVESTWGCRAPA
jgi:hypothetical protein